MSLTRTRIKNLQHASLVAMVESIAVFFFAIFIALFGPQLLLTYFFAGQPLFEQPPIFAYIPVFAFTLGAGYFLLAAIGNFRRSFQVKSLMKQMELEDCCGSCESCGTDGMHDDHGSDVDLVEMEKMVDDLLSQAKKPKKTAKKSSSTAKKGRKKSE